MAPRPPFANPAHLSIKEIQYLSLEGGGGKGNAFIGSLKALEDLLKPLKNPNGSRRDLSNFFKGFSGSSAGAITAFFLSIGYTAQEIANIMSITNFDEFFDDTIWMRRVAPMMRGRYYDYVADGVRDAARHSGDEHRLVKEILSALKSGVENIAFETQLSDEDIHSWVYSGLNLMLIKFEDEIKKAAPAVHNRIYGKSNSPSGSFRNTSASSGLEQTMKGLTSSLGIFPGLEIRWFLHKWLVLAVIRSSKNMPSPYASDDGSVAYIDKFNVDWENNGKGRPGDKIYQTHQSWFRSANIPIKKLESMNFELHWQIFGKELAITGSNIRTFQSHVFSRQTSPYFSVIDSVRISMSLPFLYKPMIITKEDIKNKGLVKSNELSKDREDILQFGPVQSWLVREGRRHWMVGTWVDGGIFNNLPIHFFDNLFLKRNVFTKTLGLRLGYDLSPPIGNFFEFCAKFFEILRGTGESHLSATRGNIHRTIEIDTEIVYRDPRKGNAEILRQISLLMFSIPEEEKEFLFQLNRNSYQRVLEYFKFEWGDKEKALKENELRACFFD